jgi:hypothetical protein
MHQALDPTFYHLEGGDISSNRWVPSNLLLLGSIYLIKSALTTSRAYIRVLHINPAKQSGQDQRRF